MSRYIATIEVTFQAETDAEAIREAKRISRTTANIHDAYAEVDTLQEIRAHCFNNRYISVETPAQPIPLRSLLSNFLKMLMR